VNEEEHIYPGHVNMNQFVLTIKTLPQKNKNNYPHYLYCAGSGESLAYTQSTSKTWAITNNLI
jgi:hypothetical protein